MRRIPGPCAVVTGVPSRGRSPAMSSGPQHPDPHPPDASSAFPPTEVHAPSPPPPPKSRPGPADMPSILGLEEEARSLLRRRLLACGCVVAAVDLCLLLLALGGDDSALHGASRAVGSALYG